MKSNNNIFEMIFFARAGQGAKSAVEILAQAAMYEGGYVQAFPQYGPERSGAPIKAFLRISDMPIRIHSPIVDPDLVIVMDDTLLKYEDVVKNLDRHESIIVNTAQSESKVKSHFKDFSGKIHLIDATGLSMEILGMDKPNAVMIGKIIQVSSICELDSVKEEFRNVFESKLGRQLTDKNIFAIEKGFDNL